MVRYTLDTIANLMNIQLPSSRDHRPHLQQVSKKKKNAYFKCYLLQHTLPSRSKSHEWTPSSIFFTVALTEANSVLKTGMWKTFATGIVSIFKYIKPL